MFTKIIFKSQFIKYNKMRLSIKMEPSVTSYLIVNLYFGNSAQKIRPDIRGIQLLD
jgi:hypothetical protein